MITDHKFKPAPFYPDRCDVKTDVGGMTGVQPCAQPGREHESCQSPESHYPERVEEGGKIYMRCIECLLFLGDISTPVPPLVHQRLGGGKCLCGSPTCPNPVVEIDLKMIIRRALRVLDQSAGGCVAEAKKILYEALDV